MEHCDSQRPEELQALPPRARDFAIALFARFPDLRRYSRITPLSDDAPSVLIVELEAPSNDPSCRLVIWTDGPEEEPSVAFGRWDTHQDFHGSAPDEIGRRQQLLDFVEDILSDRIVLVTYSDDHGEGSDGPVACEALADEMLDALTHPNGPTRLQIRSWSGRLDQQYRVDDLSSAATTD